ncbi:patatin-like phospholipase family protein [Roseixanthobacter glucoisosaccharinicivorans]|uniref:patatin-like phospholipase family protein n=1 Tax=Roseixanthobacter glucoisosaccharinicivorans TaxID=3119923 RepID=UPI003729387A
MFQGFTRRTRTDEAPGESEADPRPEVAPALEAQSEVEPPWKAGRKGGPKIALALGGGAARGFAHIGVMRALEAHGIRPSVIAGTSIGAVVGGIWAAGKLDALEDWARSLNKRNVLGFLDLSLGAAGLIAGRRLMERMRLELGDLTIEDLPVVFGCIATELGTGHEIWLTRGELVEAIHASYCLPGIFTPAKVGGRWLMDGTLVNPVPVSAARALGGRIVIAVNLNSEIFGRGTVIQDHGSAIAEVADVVVEHKKEGLSRMLRPDRMLRRQFLSGPSEGPRGISAVMIDAFNITQDRIARSRLAGDPPDVTVSPKLAKIGLFDFHRAEEAIAAGREAVERIVDDVHSAMEALK